MASQEKNEAMLAIAREMDNVPWCEDYERMVSGMLYNCLAPELMEARFRARRLTTKYNAHFPEDATVKSLEQDRNGMVEEIMGSIGPDSYIEPPFYVDYGCNIRIGDRFYSNFNMVVLDCGLVTIGNRVLFGPFVSIFAATHETEVESRRANIEYAREVSIGDDCWIGGHVTILPGVTIGEGCTIGAGSVVTKDIPPFSVAIGSPARVVKTVQPVKESA